MVAKVDGETIQNEDKEDEQDEGEEMEGGEEGKVRKAFEKAVNNDVTKVLNTLDDSVYSLTFVSMIKDI